MSLIQITPPAYEPVSLQDIKAFTRIDSDEDDNLLNHLNITARQTIENYTARSLITQQWRYTIPSHSGVAFSDPAYVLGRRFYGERGIELPRSPFIQLIGKPQLIRDGHTKDIEQYKLDMAGRIAHLHFNSLLLDQAPHNAKIQIDFEAGYSALPEQIPFPFKQAILMTVADLYDRPRFCNDNGISPPLLSETVLQLIRPYQVLRLT